MNGKIAVANVIRNRTKTKGFPDDICSVISQKGQFTYKIKKLPKDKSTYNMVSESAKAASLVMRREVEDNTFGALYFVNLRTAVHAAWLRSGNFRKTVSYSEHTFYTSRVQT